MIACTLIYVAIGVALAWNMHRVDAFSATDDSLQAAVADIVAFAVIAAGWFPLVLYVCGCHALGRRA
jgi:hypothetical protein